MDGSLKFLEWLNAALQALAATEAPEVPALAGLSRIILDPADSSLRFKFADGAYFRISAEQTGLSRRFRVLADDMDFYERTRRRSPESMIAVYEEYATLAEAAGLDYQAEEARARAEDLRVRDRIAEEAGILGIAVESWRQVIHESKRDAVAAVAVALAGRLLYGAGPEEVPAIRRRATDPLYSTPISDPEAVAAIRTRIKDQGWNVHPPPGPAIMGHTPLEIAATLARRLRARGNPQGAEQALEVVMFGVRYAEERRRLQEQTRATPPEAAVWHSDPNATPPASGIPADAAARLEAAIRAPSPVSDDSAGSVLAWRRNAVRYLAEAGGAPPEILARIATATDAELDRIMAEGQIDVPRRDPNRSEAEARQAIYYLDRLGYGPDPAAPEAPEEIAYSADGVPPFHLINPATGLPRASLRPATGSELAKIEEAISMIDSMFAEETAPGADDSDGDCVDPLTDQLYAGGYAINPEAWAAQGLPFPADQAAPEAGWLALHNTMLATPPAEAPVSEPEAVPPRDGDAEEEAI